MVSGASPWIKRTPNKVYAAGDGGLYYSTDGGTSWTRVDAEGGTTAVFADDVVLDSVNGTASTSIVYVAINGAGIFRSTAGGAGPWTNISSSSRTFPTSDLGRITLLLGPDEPETDVRPAREPLQRAKPGHFLHG